MNEVIKEKLEAVKDWVFCGLLVVAIVGVCSYGMWKAAQPEPTIAEHVLNSTVHISAYMYDNNYSTEDYLYEDFQGAWQGSGFFVREDGIIMTARHVVEDADRFIVTLRDGREFDATVVMAADNVDVGFLKIDVNEPIEHLEFATETPEVLDTVFIVGHPLGWINEWSITKGIVSNTERDCNGFFGAKLMLQADAASWPGNSGGAVVNEQGAVVGVLVGGIGNEECLSYIINGHWAREWLDVFEQYLETR